MGFSVAIVKYCIVIVFSCIGIVNSALAEINCKTSTMYPYEHSTVPLAGAFYVGSDVPVGSTLYRTTIQASTQSGIYCDAAFTVPRFYSITTEPLGSSFSFSGNPFDGEVYPTNISGIGVAFTANGTTTITKKSAMHRPSMPFSFGTAGNYGVRPTISISLIKTGPVAVGAEVTGNFLPTFIQYAGAQAGYTGLPITTYTLDFSGSIKIMTQTCKTPDVDVSMGSYELRQYFHGVGSVTPWKDSSILLENCPAFTGYYSGSNSQQSVIAGSGSSPAGGTLTSNLLEVSLQALNGYLDSTNGVIKLDSSSGSANGIGIQLGYSPDINSSPTSPTSIWKNGDAWKITPPSDGRKSFRIPLAARYYQTDKVVTPGKADGKVIFTINYL